LRLTLRAGPALWLHARPIGTRPFAPFPVSFFFSVLIDPLALPVAIVALILLEVTPAKAATTFPSVWVVFCALSFGGPFSVKGLGIGRLVMLERMHVVAAATIGRSSSASCRSGRPHFRAPVPRASSTA
jgi:hypothetical protein